MHVINSQPGTFSVESSDSGDGSESRDKSDMGNSIFAFVLFSIVITYAIIIGTCYLVQAASYVTVCSYHLVAVLHTYVACLHGYSSLYTVILVSAHVELMRKKGCHIIQMEFHVMKLLQIYWRCVCTLLVRAISMCANFKPNSILCT